MATRSALLLRRIFKAGEMMKRISYLILSMALVAAGCERQIDSKNPLQSLPDAMPAPVNVAVKLNDRAVTLTWEMPDSARVNRFRIYMAETGDTSFTLRDSSFAYSTVLQNLSVNRTYFFQLAAVEANGIEGRRSSVVSSEVGLFSITLANGSDYINRRQVQVQINTSLSASHVILSEDSLFGDAVYRPFAAGLNFTLSAGDGLKKVFAGFIFSNGTESGQPVADEIILDSRVEIDSVFFSPYGQLFSAGDMITLGLDAGKYGPDERELDGTAYVLLSRTDSVILYDDGTAGDVTADDGIYMADYYLPEGLPLVDTPLVGHFVDAAGNFAFGLSDSTVKYVNTPPAAIILAGSLSAAETVRLTWSLSNEVDFESYRIYRSNSVLTDPPSESLLIAYINDINTTSFSDYVPDAGTYHYVVYVFDRAGAMTGSNEVVITR